MVEFPTGIVGSAHCRNWSFEGSWNRANPCEFAESGEDPGIIFVECNFSVAKGLGWQLVAYRFALGYVEELEWLHRRPGTGNA